MNSPEFPGPTAQLTVRDANAAVRWYADVFKADELFRSHSPDGRVLHCELLVCGGRLLLHDQFPELPEAATPEDLGGTPVTLHLYVDDVDAIHAHALAYGAREVMAPQDAFWGDRYSMIVDPFGHRWSLATAGEEVEIEELPTHAVEWGAQGSTRPDGQPG
jgi:PhnB protein